MSTYIDMKINLDEACKELSQKLKKYPDRIHTVLVKILNETAKKGKVDLAEQARKVYDVKDEAFVKDIKQTRATKSNLTSVLYTKGKPIDLIRFNTAPVRYNPYNRPSFGVKANVLKGAPQKTLINSDGNKAFIVKMRSGHVAVAQRLTSYEKAHPKKKKSIKEVVNDFARSAASKNKERTDNKFKVLYGPSVPKMLGDVEKVYGVVRPELEKYMLEITKKQILRELKYQNYLKTKK